MAVISRMSNEEPIVGKLFFQCACGEEDHHSMKRCLLVGRVMLKYRICSDCHEMMFSVKTSRRYTIVSGGLLWWFLQDAGLSPVAVHYIRYIYYYTTTSFLSG